MQNSNTEVSFYAAQQSKKISVLSEKCMCILCVTEAEETWSEEKSEIILSVELY